MTGGLDFSDISPQDVEDAFKDLPEEEACQEVAKMLRNSVEECSTLPEIAVTASKAITFILRIIKLRLT